MIDSYFDSISYGKILIDSKSLKNNGSIKCLTIESK